MPRKAYPTMHQFEAMIKSLIDLRIAKPLLDDEDRRLFCGDTLEACYRLFELSEELLRRHDPRRYAETIQAERLCAWARAAVQAAEREYARI
jgi:hypothetical protein